MKGVPGNMPSDEPDLTWNHFETTSFSKYELNALFLRMHRENVETGQSWDVATLKKEAEIGLAESQYLLAEHYREGVD
ncbi:MAG: hypothetical protein JSR46_06390, partial [Verrucomicrobia bacterium]|nr:hypothetical protein [Verrucomicrobiota bacterium]